MVRQTKTIQIETAAASRGCSYRQERKLKSLNQDGGNEQVSVKAWAAGTLALPGMFAGGAYRTMTEVPSLSSNMPGVNVYPFMVAAAGLTWQLDAPGDFPANSTT
jgi:hypothetical protein